MKGSLLLSMRNQAQEVADGETDYFSWIVYFWQAAGAEEQDSNDPGQVGEQTGQ